VERGKLLRRRFKAKGGMLLPLDRDRQPKAEPEPKRRVYMPWPDIIPDTKRVPLWVTQGTPKKVLSLAVKRTECVSPLIKIAGQFLNKRVWWLSTRRG